MKEEEVTRIAKDKAANVGCALFVVLLLVWLLVIFTGRELSALERRIKALESAVPTAK